MYYGQISKQREYNTCMTVVKMYNGRALTHGSSNCVTVHVEYVEMSTVQCMEARWSNCGASVW